MQAPTALKPESVSIIIALAPTIIDYRKKKTPKDQNPQSLRLQGAVVATVPRRYQGPVGGNQIKAHRLQSRGLCSQLRAVAGP